MKTLGFFQGARFMELFFLVSTSTSLTRGYQSSIGFPKKNLRFPKKPYSSLKTLRFPTKPYSSLKNPKIFHSSCRNLEPKLAPHLFKKPRAVVVFFSPFETETASYNYLTGFLANMEPGFWGNAAELGCEHGAVWNDYV